MKTKVKALAAALTLLAAGQANAAISDDNALTSQFGGSGSGELFLSVVNRGTGAESYVRDLGITASQFVNANSTANNSVGTFNFGPDVNMTQLLSDATANGDTVSWNIAAADNQYPPAPYGYLTTSPSTVTTSNTPVGIEGIAPKMTKLGSYVKAVNAAANAATGASITDYAANNSVIVGSSDNAFYDGINWGGSWAGPSTEGKLGNSLGFYFVGVDPAIATTGADQTVVSAFSGQWTLSANGTLTYGAPAPVPLPPAVWLLGSALVGLVGVGRRRTGTAA